MSNLQGARGRHLYEKLYLARGQAENHIKGCKSHLASDRTSCTMANANQMRLMLHGCAYWICWKLCATWPKRSPTLPVAPLSNRHAAVASRQARHHYRRKEDEDNGDPASLMPAPKPYPPPVGRSRIAVPRLTPKSRPLTPKQQPSNHQSSASSVAKAQTQSLSCASANAQHKQGIANG